MTMYGADADQLDAFAAELEVAADQFERSSGGLTGLLTNLAWIGGFADNFRSLWSARHSPSLRSSAVFFRESARTLRENAQQQREASSSGSAGPAFPMPHLGRLRPKDLPDPGTYVPDNPKARPEHIGTDRLTGPLFNGTPDWNNVTQGNIGDCYFVAAIAGLAMTDPDALMKMIHDNGDGTYTVTFAGGKSVTVDGDVYVDANGNPLYGRVGADGSIWFPIVEKAYAQLRGGYDAIGHGTETIDTGLADLLGFSQPHPVSQASAESTWRLMQSQTDANHVVVVGTVGTPSNPAIVGGHAYLVEDVYELPDGSRHVKLYNPHGDETNPAHYSRFDLPYDQFLRDYCQVSVPLGYLDVRAPSNIA